MKKHQQTRSALTLYAPALARLPERIRRLLDAAYAAHGGAEHMNLDDWRDVEQEVKRRLEYEHQKRLR